MKRRITISIEMKAMPCSLPSFGHKFDLFAISPTNFKKGATSQAICPRKAIEMKGVGLAKIGGDIYPQEALTQKMRRRELRFK